MEAEPLLTMTKKRTQQPASKVVGERKKNGGKKAVPRGQKSVVPLAMARNERTRMPKITGSPYQGDGRVRVRHREYIQDVLGSVLFSAQLISINPGLSTMFPWLSVLAQQFESYLFRRFKLCYETQKSASTSGTLMLAVDYDAGDSVPLSKQALMAYHNAVRSAVWNECCFMGDVLDLKKFGAQRYIRTGSLAANLDIKTYDVGNVILAVQGEADASAIGELYVEYDVELITPQVQADPSLAVSFYESWSGSSRAAPFTTVLTGPIGGLQVSASGATITFNKTGKYLVQLNAAGTVFTDTSPTLTGTASSAVVTPAGVFHNTAATSALFSILVTISELGQTVILDLTASCTTCTSVSLRVASFSAA